MDDLELRQQEWDTAHPIKRSPLDRLTLKHFLMLIWLLSVVAKIIAYS